MTERTDTDRCSIGDEKSPLHLHGRARVAGGAGRGQGQPGYIDRAGLSWKTHHTFRSVPSVFTLTKLL